MNSFNTDEDTHRVIQKYANHNLEILTFNQSRYPRVGRDSLTPVPKTPGSSDGWYPPGHGDFFDALNNSGLLDRLLAAGKEVIFLSNGDNLGAVVDMNILQHMVDTQSEFIMEVRHLFLIYQECSDLLY
jgi:UTP--glucose-1-phosphate uridylyltransferase